MWRFRLFALVIVYGLFAGAAVGLYFEAINIPPSWNPWGIIDLEGEMGPFTRRQLRDLHNESELCQVALSVTAMEYDRHPGRPVIAGCGITNGVRIYHSELIYNRPYLATCGLAAAMYVFEREVVQRAAQKHFGQPVVRIDHSGTYACRNIGFREGGPRSQHARAKAMDMVRFHFQDGTNVRVSKVNWDSDGPEGAFLKDIHKGACRLFGTALGPDYNKMHHTHFHLDMRPNGACR